jgi:hypothetical protein
MVRTKFDRPPYHFHRRARTTILQLDTWRYLMSANAQFTDAAIRCAFCVKPLPIVGELQPWRAPSGLFFCDEFCADDAEEARFQSYRRAKRGANDLRTPAST